MPNLLGVTPTDISALVGSVAALGTAASGLVDSTKVLRGGISNVGFGWIKKGLHPVEAALVSVLGNEWEIALRGPWINGAAQSDQIAAAKSLIHVGLSPESAPTIATNLLLDVPMFETVVASLKAGTAFTTAQQVEYNKFDSVLTAKLTCAFERADQSYRNASKALAGLFAVVLAAVGGGLVYASKSGFSLTFFASKEFLLSVVAGAVAVPLAPVAKDLTSSLAAAVKAAQGVGAYVRPV